MAERVTEMRWRVGRAWKHAEDICLGLSDAIYEAYSQKPAARDLAGEVAGEVAQLVDLAREIHSTAARIMALVGGRNEDTGAAIEVLDTLADAIQGRPDYEDDEQAREQLRYFVRELRASADEVERRARCTPSS